MRYGPRKTSLNKRTATVARARLSRQTRKKVPPGYMHQLDNTQKPLLKDLEEQIALNLSNKLAEQIKGVENTLLLIGKVIESTPTLNYENVSLPFKVTTSLLIKIANDLRTIWMLGTKGYAIQAATLASSLYESSFAIGFIGNNVELAKEWNEHVDFENAPFSVSRMTRGALKNIPSLTPKKRKDLFDSNYSIYRILSAIKHGNPVNQKNHFYVIEDNTVIADLGPEISKYSLGVTRFSINQSIRFVILALTSYINYQLIDLEIPDFNDDFNVLSDFVENLIKKTEDNS